MRIYTIEQLKMGNWCFIGYPEYLEYLNKFQNELNSFFDFLDKWEGDKSFKWYLEVGAVQYLLGVFPNEKEIRVASKQLNLELNILSLDLPQAQEFREHASKIAELPLINSPMVIEEVSLRHELPLFEEGEFDAVHQRENELSQELIKKIRTYRQSLFERISDFGLDLTANYMLIRIHLLKFLAILPNLDHDKKGKEVKRIFIESLTRLVQDSQMAARKNLKGQKRPLPPMHVLVVQAILKISSFLSPRILAFGLRSAVAMMAKRFIAGEDIEKASQSLGDLRKSHRDATIDQLGELVVSSVEADIYLEKVLEIIAGVNNGHIKGDKNSAGILRSHVSIKVSALAHDFKAQDFIYTYDQVAPRLIKILAAAKENQVFINIDAEHYHFRDIVFEIYSKVLLETASLQDFDQTGIVVQGYLRDGIDHLKEVIKLARKRNLIMPIRLVKGAYWDAETIEADAHNFNAPQFLNKEETDIHFRQLVFYGLKSSDAVQLAIASHNINDHCFAKALREKVFPAAPEIEHQCLHMTYEALSVGLSKMGWATRNYIPVGDLLVGMAYLVRRIMENSSQVGVLTIMRSHKKGNLFRLPIELVREKKLKNKYQNDQSLNNLSKEFRNVFPVRSYLNPHFKLIKDKLGKDQSDLASGKLYYDQGDIKVYSSSHPKLLLGRVKFDTPAEVGQKIENLFHGYNKGQWSSNSVARFVALHRLADLMLLERTELTSLIMMEAGKTIDEATADVDEAIDFVNFYIREQMKLEETNAYAPRGVVGVIAPWNFPLAIPCGMTIAALVAGNSAILKPAEQTNMIALKFIDLCHRAGIPENIVNISLGEGEVGASMVDHNLIVGIVFTGSRAVGEIIYKNISTKQTASKYDFEPINKFAITEMGGKNAIIVTNNCELDETVSGIIYSAFAHAGQKCSAASRIIIDNEIKDAFLKRFIKAIEDIKVGPSTNFSTMVNPLISKEDRDRVRAMAKRAEQECSELGGTVHISRYREEFESFCVAPSLFELPREVVLKENTVATEEVFGPVIHLVAYDTLEQALEIFNSTEYALTGGIFCQSQDDIDFLTPKMEVGNIYINRPNTGARVAIEPFGGFKMSGTGPKAGGQDYLIQFNRLKETAANSKIEFEDVEDTKEFYFAHASKLPIERRLYMARKFIKSLAKQFEVYFGKITEVEKQKLVGLHESILRGEFNLDKKEYPNRYIPGQISFNKKDMQLGNGLMIDDKYELDIQAVIDLCINLIIGNGITVLATNSKAYDKWNEVIKLAHLKGFSAFNLNLGLVDYEELIRTFEKEDFQFVIFTGKEIDHDLKELIFKRDYKGYLVKVFTTGYRDSWEQGINTFTHTRSFAINTMRHGAPLELTL